MIMVTLLSQTIEGNPMADYVFEQDRTEAIKQALEEFTIIACLLILSASGSFKYARIIKFSD